MAQRSKKPDSSKRTRRATPKGNTESGQPGGGRGRIDRVGRTGVYPGSGPFPAGQAEVKTPESFVHGQRDEEGRQVEGGSEISLIGGMAVGGETPPSSSPPFRPSATARSAGRSKAPRRKG